MGKGFVRFVCERRRKLCGGEGVGDALGVTFNVVPPSVLQTNRCRRCRDESPCAPTHSHTRINSRRSAFRNRLAACRCYVSEHIHRPKKPTTQSDITMDHNAPEDRGSGLGSRTFLQLPGLYNHLFFFFFFFLNHSDKNE